MSYLDQLVSIAITADTTTPTRAGFGTPLIAAHHTRWNERVREYTSLAAMTADGFLSTDVAYRIAAVMLAQSPRVSKVKVGRRALAFQQVFVITPNAPVDAGAVETYAVEIDGLTATFTTDGSPTVAEVTAGLTAAINALADADAILAGGASTGGLQTLTGASINGVIGRGVMTPPRPVTLALSNHADWNATTAVIHGTNAAGAAISENFAIPDGGNATVTGTKHFRTVTSIVIPLQGGPGGTFTVGVRAPVTAVDGATVVTCTAPVTGELHTVALLTPNAASGTNLQLRDATVDPGIAADLDAILLADSDWYGLTLDSNSEAEIAVAALWTEANGKLFVAQTADTATMDPASTTDVGADLAAAGYARTALHFAPTIGTNWLAAGVLAERLPADPGSDTWRYKSPAGVSVYTLTDSQRSALHNKGVNTFTTIAGLRLTEPGVTSSGEYTDVTRFIDWLHARMQERLFALLTGAPKLPYTDASVDLVRGEVLAQLDAAVTVGGLAADPAPTVTAPRVADVSSVDRAARHLPGVTFSARLGGAIHTLEVSGTVRA